MTAAPISAKRVGSSGLGRPASRVRNAVNSPRWRFGALSAVGFALVLLQSVRGTNERFDFWEHAATVRQLMLHTTNPGNALLAIHAPSAFFSPYALLVAVGGKLTTTGPVHALAAAGLINYWLLVAGIWCFTGVFSKHQQAPFYALLFVWLLWGISPWEYSGFFNLRALSEVIAYPATFATAIGMLIAALWQAQLHCHGPTRWIAAALTTVGLAVVVLTHPVAGAAAGAAMLAISVTAPERGRELSLLLVIAVGVVLLCLAWPYFSMLRLLDDQGVYDPSNSVMYSSWIERIFPALAALALFFYNTGTLRRARLGVYCLPLVALFIYGDLSRHYSAGRVISYIVLGAQIGLADLAANLERPALLRLRGRRIAFAVGAIAVLAIAQLFNMRGGLRGSLPGTGSEPPIYAEYHAAVNGLPANATIAAPINDGAEAAIPVYAGRLIATHRPLAFVKDQTQRQQAVYQFFSPSATSSYRTEIIVRYHVRYILVPAGSGPLVEQLSQFGSVIRNDAAFDTIAVKPLPVSARSL